VTDGQLSVNGNHHQSETTYQVRDGDAHLGKGPLAITGSRAPVGRADIGLEFLHPTLPEAGEADLRRRSEFQAAARVREAGLLGDNVAKKVSHAGVGCPRGWRGCVAGRRRLDVRCTRRSRRDDLACVDEWRRLKLE
jgi:hypothetical protein